MEWQYRTLICTTGATVPLIICFAFIKPPQRCDFTSFISILISSFELSQQNFSRFVEKPYFVCRFVLMMWPYYTRRWHQRSTSGARRLQRIWPVGRVLSLPTGYHHPSRYGLPRHPPEICTIIFFFANTFTVFLI